MTEESRGLSRGSRAGGGALANVATWVLLAAIVAAGMALAAGYAVGVTPWNAPDEPAHYNYVKYLATTSQLPELKPGDWDSALLERLKSSKFPSSQPVDSIRYENWQPPLFYLLAAPLYNTNAALPVSERVIVLRMLSVALSGVTILLAFLTVRTVFPREPDLQLAVAGFVAFLPQRSSIAGSINNDALAEMIAALLLLLLVQIARSGFRKGQALLLGLTLGAALLTKMTLYGYVPAALLAVALFPGKGGNSTRGGSRVKLLGIAVAVAAVVGGWWFARNALLYGGMDVFGSLRHDQVVVGQPRLERLDAASLSYLGTTLFKSFWGQFGWMGVLIDERLYLVLALVSGLAGFGLALFLGRVVFGKGLLIPHQKVSLALMGLATGVVFAQLAYYNLTFLQAQGRYLYPALVPIALFFVLGLREVMAPIHARLLLSLSVASLALLNFVCLTRYVVPFFRP